MGSEGTQDRRKSLLLKYKSTETVIDINIKDDAKPEAIDHNMDSNVLHLQEVEQEQLSNLSNNIALVTDLNQEGALQVVALRRKKKEEEKELELEKLKAKLAEYEEVIEAQRYELKELRNELSKETGEKERALKELDLMQKSIFEKETELNHTKEEISKEDIDKLIGNLSITEAKYLETSISLDKERKVNAEIKDELLSLKESLSSSLKMEKQLESFIEEETAKSKKLEKQLIYLLDKYNDQRKCLYNSFQSLYDHSEQFLQTCEGQYNNLSERLSKINM